MAERKVQIRVSVDDADAVKRLDSLAAKLDKLSKGTFTIKLRLDDGGTTAKLDRIAARLDKIGTKTYTPKIKTDGITKADAELGKFNAQLDKIGHKRVTATVRVRTDHVGGLGTDLGKLIGGGGGSIGKDVAAAAGGGGGGAGSGLLSSLGGANNQYTGGLIAALVAYASLIAPAIIPLGLGGIIGGGAAGGAAMLGSRAHQQLLRLAQQLQGAKGPQKKVIEQQMAAIQQRSGPELQTFGAFRQLGHSALGVFNEALTSKGQGFSGGPGGHPGTSFLQGLDALLKGLAPAMKAFGPVMGEMFRASLPSMQAFMKIMLQFAKAVMPAVLQVLKQLQPDLPIIIRGFKYLSDGIAGFIKNLGPGIKASAIIFKTSMMIAGAILRAVGSAATGFSILLVKTVEGVHSFATKVPHYFDEMRHETAVIFDGVRHDIAHIWDMIFSDTIGNVERMVNGVSNWDARLRHGIANDFDAIRHFIASAWDTIYNNTIGKISHLVSVVVNWFKGLPSKVQGALRGLGAMLQHIGSLALQMLLAGLKAAAGPVLSFVQSIGHGIMHIFDVAIGRKSPSKAFYAAGVDIMRGLDQGIKSHYPVIKGRMGHVGGSVVSWIKESLKLAGKPMSWLPAMERLVSLESGGNPNIINQTSVPGYGHAMGLYQMMASTLAAYGGGSPFNPITEGVAALRYISSRYGSPFNIPGLFGGGYQGYAKGGPILEPILGMGLRSGTTYGFGENGIHEKVVPMGGGSGGGGGISIVVQGALDADSTARQVLKILKRYQTRHGGIALNLA